MNLAVCLSVSPLFVSWFFCSSWNAWRKWKYLAQMFTILVRVEVSTSFGQGHSWINVKIIYLMQALYKIGWIGL